MTTVLVVDDSALVRKVLRRFFEDEGMTVETARSGLEALARLKTLRPDVMTLDIQMPDLDGLSVLHRVMTSHAVPVVMVSVLTSEGSRTTMEALALGAVDFVAKPDASVSLRLDEVRHDLVGKVSRAARAHVRTRTSAGAALRPVEHRPTRQPVHVSRRPTEVVLIGSSTGGPAALSEIISALPRNFPPVVIAQHLPAAFTPHLSDRLGRTGGMRSEEAGAPTQLRWGTVYVGRGDADVLLTRRRGELVVKSVPAHPEGRWHPGVDRLVRSALDVVPPANLIGVLLSGMGDDGAETMCTLAGRGGRTIAESQESAVVWGMPGALVERGGATVVLETERIAEQLRGWVPLQEPPGAPAPVASVVTEEVGHGAHAQDSRA